MKNANLLDQDLCRPFFATAMRNISSRARAQNNWSSVSQNMNQRAQPWHQTKQRPKLKASNVKLSVILVRLSALVKCCPPLFAFDNVAAPKSFGFNPTPWYSTKASIKIFSHAPALCIHVEERFCIFGLSRRFHVVCEIHDATTDEKMLQPVSLVLAKNLESAALVFALFHSNSCQSHCQRTWSLYGRKTVNC